MEHKHWLVAFLSNNGLLLIFFFHCLSPSHMLDFSAPFTTIKATTVQRIGHNNIFATHMALKLPRFEYLFLFRMFPIQLFAMGTAKFEPIIFGIIHIDNFSTFQTSKRTNQRLFPFRTGIFRLSLSIGRNSTRWWAIFLPIFGRRKLFSTPLTFHAIHMPPFITAFISETFYFTWGDSDILMT